MSLEAILLTGGASRRMGSDKASLRVAGEAQAHRIARMLREIKLPVTVLGREPIPGCAFIADEEAFAGPLAALSRFQPEGLTYVFSCDMPLFDPRITTCLYELQNAADAAVPVVDGNLQPLCALYTPGAFAKIPEVLAEGKRSMMAWLDRLKVSQINEELLGEYGLHPRVIQSANTPEELQDLIG